MGVLKEHGGLFYANMLQILFPLGLMKWMFSRGCAMVLFAKCKINIPPFGRHSLHDASHWSSCANFVSNPYCEIYGKVIIVLFFFPLTTEKESWIFKPAN
jgi:hypothetical protein